MIQRASGPWIAAFDGDVSGPLAHGYMGLRPMIKRAFGPWIAAFGPLITSSAAIWTGLRPVIRLGDKETDKQTTERLPNTLYKDPTEIQKKKKGKKKEYITKNMTILKTIAHVHII